MIGQTKEELEILAFNGETHTERMLARKLVELYEQKPIYQVDWGEGWHDVDLTDYERYSNDRGISSRIVYLNPCPPLPDVIDAIVNEVLAVDTIASTSVIKSLFWLKTGKMRFENSAGWNGQLTDTHCTPKSVNQMSTGTSVGEPPDLPDLLIKGSKT